MMSTHHHGSSFAYKTLIIASSFTYVFTLTIITQLTEQKLTNSSLVQKTMPELTANDEEVNMSELDGHNTSPVHIVDRQSWLMFPSHQPSLPPNVSANLSSNLNHDLQFQQNCSYSFDEVFCDCDPIIRRFSCYNIQNVEDVRRAFSHLLNATRMVYWSQLEVHCVEPLANDEPADKNVTPQKSFHVSYEMFTEGPKFESILFVGDCSKPKHYDNLITVDREVQKIIMIKNMLRMATSCSLLQPKFERLTELIIKDCIVAGDMISSTFSTRCLGNMMCLTIMF